MTDHPSPQTISKKHKGLLGTVKFAFSLFAIVGLLSTNIATLTSDIAHSTVFDALKQAIGYALGDKLANRLLNDSPTEIRKTDVARKTTALQSSVDTLEQEKKSFQADNDGLEQRNRKISAEHDELNTKHQKLAADHEDLNSRHNKLSADHDSLNAKHATLTNTSKMRQDKVRQISARSIPRLGGIATKSLATLPGRATPYIGAAVSFTFTGWELIELCNMMKDIEELNVTFGNVFNDPNNVCGLPRPSVPDFY